MADCQHALVPVTPQSIQNCQQDSDVNVFQALALRPYLQPLPPDALNPGKVEPAELAFYRDIMPLVLGMLAAPFALAAAWRHFARRSTLLWLSGWVVLVVASAALTIWAAITLVSPPRGGQLRESFAIGLGPGLVVLGVGALGLLGVVAWGWWQLVRHLTPLP
jgi:hypothetical protein